MSMVIFTAGKGIRTYSDLPRALYTPVGKSMVQYIIDAVNNLGACVVYLVYGHGGNLLRQTSHEDNLNWVLQAKQFGTGHVTQQAVPFSNGDEDILMLYGDVPLISVEALQRLCVTKLQGGIGSLTVGLDDPAGYGCITRGDDQVMGVVKHKDASKVQHQIQEINTRILIVNGTDLKRWLAKLTNDNAQGEYYATDTIVMAYQEEHEIVAVYPQRLSETEDVNNRLQPVRLERVYQAEWTEELLLVGMTLRDPARFDLRGTLQYGRGVEIDINAILEGNAALGGRAKIGAGCVIKNSIIGDDCEVSPRSVVEDVQLQVACTISLFARLRSGIELLEGACVDNFMEVKKARPGKDLKVGHLTYLGDTEVGGNVNTNAGTITCNHDGTNKHRMITGDDVFVGSDTQLVVPVTVGSGVTVTTGIIATRDIASNELVSSHVSQVHKQGWQRPVRKK